MKLYNFYFCILIFLLLFIIIAIHSLYNYYSPYKKKYNNYINNELNKLIELSSNYEKNIKKEDIIVPKIVHKIAPQDKTKWRPIWTTSHNSWIKYFPEPEYKIMMWSDDNDIYIFIKNKFPWFYQTFCEYPHNIQRFDIVRFFILYEYGGIYADMDYEVFKNFYDLIPNDKISIVENGNMFNKKKLFLENSLMVSPPKQIFWIDALKLAITRSTKMQCMQHNICCINNCTYVLYSTGPLLITDIYIKEYQNKIHILNKKLYNGYNTHKKNINKKNIPNDIIGLHYWTTSWMNKFYIII